MCIIMCFFINTIITRSIACLETQQFQSIDICKKHLKIYIPPVCDIKSPVFSIGDKSKVLLILLCLFVNTYTCQMYTLVED